LALQGRGFAARAATIGAMNRIDDKAVPRPEQMPLFARSAQSSSQQPICEVYIAAALPVSLLYAVLPISQTLLFWTHHELAGLAAATAPRSTPRSLAREAWPATAYLRTSSNNRTGMVTS
jgi:hypothetical protein